MDELFEFMESQIKRRASKFKRYMYDSLPWDSQMFALVGARGIGKTTLFLQHIKEEKQRGRALYVSLDHVYFASNTILDLANDFSKMGGEYLYIDEVHSYPNWSRELKNIYDAHPNLHVYFTGSSALNILAGEADLSRRAAVHTMQGLSFREYLGLFYNIEFDAFTLEEILDGKAKVPGVEHPLPLFKEYLERGYYPFMKLPDSALLLEQTISSTLQFDIPLCANLSLATGRKLKKLLVVIAESVPYKPKVTKLSKKIEASRNSVNEYLELMENAGMIARLRSAYSGFADLGKVEKIYLDNTTLMHTLARTSANQGCMRETFFFNQMREKNNVFASAASDFEIDGVTFEVGGRSKTSEQIKGLSNAYLAKDNIEDAYRNVIPLWCFGLNY